MEVPKDIIKAPLRKTQADEEDMATAKELAKIRKDLE